MNFLLDQDVYAATARFLRELGHDVIPVAQLGLSQAEDEALLKVTHAQNHIFVTRDRGHLPDKAVVILRYAPAKY